MWGGRPLGDGQMVAGDHVARQAAATFVRVMPPLVAGPARGPATALYIAAPVSTEAGG